jgi:hypothetical protein
MVPQKTGVQEHLQCLPRACDDRCNHATHQPFLVRMDRSCKRPLDRSYYCGVPLWRFDDAAVLWDKHILEFHVSAVCCKCICREFVYAILFRCCLSSFCHSKYVPLPIVCADILVIEGIGIGFSMTVMGCFAILLVPIPFLFFKYGDAIRAKSPYLNPKSGKPIV